MTNYRSYESTFPATVNTGSLLSKVLAITAVGFLFTALGVYLSPPAMSGAALIGLFVLGLGLIVGVRLTRETPGVALGLFYLFTLAEGFAISPAIFHYTHHGLSRVVFEAAFTTAVGMAAIAILAQLVRLDYEKVTNIGIAALLVLLVVGIVSMFLHFMSPNLYAWLTLAVFSVLTLGDFLKIRAGGGAETAVEMALEIYLDALNIFLALLQLFGDQDSD